MAKASPLFVYVGTYTHKGSEGIHVYRLDPSTGKLEFSSAAGIENPSFLAFDPTKRYLYAVNELGTYQGQPGGAISAFKVDAETGALTLINQQPTHGSAPCHVSIGLDGQYAYVANYNGGNLTVLPIDENGALGEPSDVVQHHGSSAHPRRQTRPYAHSITIDPGNRFAFACDLGIDKIMVYRIDEIPGKLVPHDPPWADIHPGAGPRHFCFHPSYDYAYVINEVDSTLTAFAYDREKGTLSEVQTISSLPAGTTVPNNTTADIHVAPSGRYLYGSNRVHDSIAIFAIDAQTGKLEWVGHESTRGKTPRNFCLDASGTLLLAANQDSDSIVSFRVDTETGLLAPTGHTTEVSMPVCVKIVALS